MTSTRVLHAITALIVVLCQVAMVAQSTDIANLPSISQPATARPGLPPTATNKEVECDPFRGIVVEGQPVRAAHSVGDTFELPAPGESPAITSEALIWWVRYSFTDRMRTWTVIGADDRVRISPTTSYPWRTQCKLVITFPNNSRWIGSGTLIASKYVLTAGHCVYVSSQGGWARSIEVIPALDGSSRPYGTAWATRLRTYTGWTQYQSSDHDFALITLDRTVGNSTGWLGYGYWSSVMYVTGNIAGYPGDRDSGLRLYYHYGSILSDSGYQVQYTIDTAGGQSGSGVYRILNGSRYVFAVHAWGSSTRNGGTKIDSSKYNSIASWIASGQ